MPVSHHATVFVKGLCRTGDYYTAKGSVKTAHGVPRPIMIVAGCYRGVPSGLMSSSWVRHPRQSRRCAVAGSAIISTRNSGSLGPIPLL